ncbi:MAG: hypothetical protein ABIJ04_03655 [Bacteroidota bacterium]|uniref:Uncharacterized protein n=1 Tax=viral metagenome TaxID=1070528 RepID=A0A6M3LV88_9ZZZZ
MVFTTKIQPYAVITLAAGALADSAQGAITLRGVSVGTWKANSITVLTLAGGTLSFKLDKNTNDSIDASAGLKIEGSIFRDIFWTKAAATTATIFIVWVD